MSKSKKIEVIRKFDYDQFICRLQSEANEPPPCETEIIGYEKAVLSLRRQIDKLVSHKSTRPYHMLVTGPSGTGKTFIVDHVAESYPNKKLNYVYLKSGRTLDKRFGDPCEHLEVIFSDAITKAPSLIFMDDIDKVCEKKYSNDAYRVSNALDYLLQTLRKIPARVLVIGATSQKETLDSHIAKYFQSEIELTFPNLSERRTKLINTIKLHTPDQIMSAEEIDQISEATQSYSFGDIEKLCLSALEEFDGTQSCYKFFKKAIRDLKPELKSVTSYCPPVRWDDIGGFDQTKMQLQKAVMQPLKRRSQYQRSKLKPIKGILLYGPPGCSKTMLAQALATESGFNFISIRGPELNSKYVGDSEAAVRKLYKNARDIAPCIIFFDEIDAFAPERSKDSSSSVGDRVTTQLLTELNGVEPLNDVFTIAATNRPDKVDSALLRPGRLDPIIYVPLPTQDDRAKIFVVHMRELQELKLDINEAAVEFAEKTHGYSGADISSVCRLAAEIAFDERSDLEDPPIEKRHFEVALEKVKPTTRITQLKKLSKFRKMTLSHIHEEKPAVTATTNISFFSEEFNKLNISNK